MAATGIYLAADVLVERNGRIVALRTEDGTLALPQATRANYSVDNWLLADGENRERRRSPPIARPAATCSAASAR